MHDRRIKRTQDALARALISLSTEKTYDSITIRDITERANVGYATFYRHYSTKEALVLEVLDQTIQELIELLRPTAERGDLHTAGHQLFNYVEQNQDLLRTLLAAQATPTVQQHIHQSIRQRILKTLPTDGPVPPEIAAHHLSVASTALIQWWLEQDKPYSTKRMGEIYARLVVEPAQGPASGPQE